jgi:hypothetical protein
MTDLRPGDLLCYPPTSFIGHLIVLKTWSRPPVSHVEVYLGDGKSAAARAQGVNIYTLRHDWSLVLRPTLPFDRDAALAWMETVRGQRYDFLGLFSSFLARKQGHPDKMYCSELAARLYRKSGMDPFSRDFDADQAAPATFLCSPFFERLD